MIFLKTYSSYPLYGMPTDIYDDMLLPAPPPPPPPTNLLTHTDDSYQKTYAIFTCFAHFAHVAIMILCP